MFSPFCLANDLCERLKRLIALCCYTIQGTPKSKVLGIRIISAEVKAFSPPLWSAVSGKLDGYQPIFPAARYMGSLSCPASPNRSNCLWQALEYGVFQATVTNYHTFKHIFINPIQLPLIPKPCEFIFFWFLQSSAQQVYNLR